MPWGTGLITVWQVSGGVWRPGCPRPRGGVPSGALTLPSVTPRGARHPPEQPGPRRPGASAPVPPLSSDRSSSRPSEQFRVWPLGVRPAPRERGLPKRTAGRGGVRGPQGKEEGVRPGGQSSSSASWGAREVGAHRGEGQPWGASKPSAMGRGLGVGGGRPWKSSEACNPSFLSTPASCRLASASLGVNPRVRPCPRGVWRPLGSREQCPCAGLLSSRPRGPSCLVSSFPPICGHGSPHERPSDPGSWGPHQPLWSWAPSPWGVLPPASPSPPPTRWPGVARAQLGTQRKAGERQGRVSRLPSVGSWGGPGTGPRV